MIFKIFFVEAGSQGFSFANISFVRSSCFSLLYPIPLQGAPRALPCGRKTDVEKQANTVVQRLSWHCTKTSVQEKERAQPDVMTGRSHDWPKI